MIMINNEPPETTLHRKHKHNKKEHDYSDIEDDLDKNINIMNTCLNANNIMNEN